MLRVDVEYRMLDAERDGADKPQKAFVGLRGGDHVSHQMECTVGIRIQRSSVLRDANRLKRTAITKGKDPNRKVRNTRERKQEIKT